MPFEIERKFLVRHDSWRASVGGAMYIRQGYLTRNGSISLRIRLIDNVRAMLTVKSAVVEIRRLEFEYEIPLCDGVTMLGLREGGIVEKLRYKMPWQGLIWEIDVFMGDNQGLIVAEIELPHEDREFDKPDWLGTEVTSDPRFSNASLAKTPYCRWGDELTAAPKIKRSGGLWRL